MATDEFAHQFFMDTVASHYLQVCTAGAEGQEDIPMAKPKRTRKRRPDEAETRPARKHLAKDEQEPAPIRSPTATATRAGPAIKEERDVDMQQALPVQSPQYSERLPTTPIAQAPTSRPDVPSSYPAPASAPLHSTGTTGHSDEDPRVKEPSEAATSSTAAFLTPPPKARPRSANTTPRGSTTEAQQGTPPDEAELHPSKASPRALALKEIAQKEVGDFIPHDARLKCDFHRIERQHVPEELRIDHPDSGLLLPDLSVFLHLSFFENRDQPTPRKGHGSVYKPDQANSSKFWGTGYYCLFCKLKNRSVSGAWGKPYPTIAALLSHGSGSNCIPIAYLCLLRKQYHWHKERLTAFVLKKNSWVGDKAIWDETRHPNAVIRRIWCIVTTKGMCDEDYAFPPAPGQDDPRQKDDPWKGQRPPALSHRSPPPPPPFNLDPAASIPPPPQESEVQFQTENFPDDPDSSGSSMDDGYQEFTFSPMFLTPKYLESTSSFDIPLLFKAKPVSPSSNTRQHALSIPTGCSSRDLYDAGFRLFRAIPMCRPRKLSHTGDFAFTPSTAKYLCAVPRTSGFFNTQFKEFDPNSDPEDEEQQSDSAETAKSNLTHNDDLHHLLMEALILLKAILLMCPVKSLKSLILMTVRRIQQLVLMEAR